MRLNRRAFFAGLSGLIGSRLFVRSFAQSPAAQQKEEFDMQLRPHHILDIISDHGKGTTYQPHPYGHSLFIVAPMLLSNLDAKIKLVLAADAICEGCKHLLPDGQCKDVLAQLHPSPSKQAYNDVLDCRLFDLFAIEPNSIKTIRQFLEIVNEHVPGLERICTHPKENQEERLQGLVDGLVKLGIRES